MCMYNQMDNFFFFVSWQDFSIPTQSRLTGSVQKDKCQTELLCVLETEGKTAHLEVRAECRPKITLEIQFRHDLPQLKDVPRENKLSITSRKQLNYQIGLGVKSGSCELQMNGDFHPEKKLQWKMSVENKCKTIQVQERIFCITLDFMLLNQNLCTY